MARPECPVRPLYLPSIRVPTIHHKSQEKITFPSSVYLKRFFSVCLFDSRVSASFWLTKHVGFLHSRLVVDPFAGSAMSTAAVGLTASGDVESLFELMTAEVIMHLDGIRAGHILAAALTAWHERSQRKRTRRDQIKIASGLANWSCKNSQFYALLAYQKQCDAERTVQALEFWRQNLLQCVFCAWGPLFKLHRAACIGEADRCLRRIVLRCRLRQAFEW